MDVKFWTDEWAVVSAAPILSLLLCGAGALAGWLAKTAILAGEIATLRERLSLANERERASTTALGEVTKAKESLDQLLADLQRKQAEAQVPTEVVVATAKSLASSKALSNIIALAGEAMSRAARYTLVSF